MNILVVGSHPDDIEYGCGGTLIKLAKANHRISLLVMSYGEVGGNPKIREKEQNSVTKMLNAKLFWANLPDTNIMVNRETIGTVERILKETKSDLVFTHYHNDTHQDHRHVSQIVMTATRYIRNVLFYEVPTTIDFSPTIFINIGDSINDKLKLVRLHKSQVHLTKVEKLSILESVKATAIFRGYQYRVKYAEGFMPLRFSLKMH